MKTFVRLLTLLLALLMLAMTVVACDEGDDTEDDIGNSAVADTFGREGDDLPADLDYKQDEISVLNWNAENPEFDIETISADNVQNALYDRNGEIERRLSVSLTFTTEEGDVSHMKPFVALVQRVYESETHDFDIIASYSRTEGMLAIQGYLEDLKLISDSYINLDKPWWPDNMISTVSIADSMYFISGDISPNVLHLMQVLYFNKNMLNQYWNQEAINRGVTAELDEDGKEIVSAAARMIYQWAYDGTWTLDKLIELSHGADGEGIYIDNGETADTKDPLDTYGFTSTAYQIDCFYTGSNLRLIEHVDTGEVLKVSDDYGSFKTVRLVDEMGKWFRTSSCYTEANSSGNYAKSWNKGKAMFVAMRAHGVKNLDADGWSYGVMPVPKYNEKQANYYTCMGNPFTLYGIFKGMATSPSTQRPDVTRSGDRPAALREMTAIIECWASETYRLVTPEVFEVNMQLKYADTQYETDMFEIVRSSVVFDLGRIFANDMAYMSELPSRSAVYGASWASTYASYKNSLNTKLEQIVEKLA